MYPEALWIYLVLAPFLFVAPAWASVPVTSLLTFTGFRGAFCHGSAAQFLRSFIRVLAVLVLS
jgi:hypothetical protein